MATISGKYLGNLCSELTHNPSGVKISVDGNGKGFSPVDLTAASLGACMMAMMAYTAESKGIRPLGLCTGAAGRPGAAGHVLLGGPAESGRPRAGGGEGLTGETRFG